MSATPDPGYLALTEKALQEDQALLRAYEEKERVAQPPPPPPVPPEQQAAILRDGAGGAYLYGATAAVLGRGVSLPGCQLYLRDFVRQARDSGAPVEAILLEELATTHHLVGQLQVRAGAAGAPQEAQAYLAAAARLMAEVRRTALALQAFRQGPPAGKGRKGAPRARRPRKVPAGAASGRGEARPGGRTRAEVGTTNRVNRYLDEDTAERALP
jgi:hypothetical protein